MWAISVRYRVLEHDVDHLSLVGRDDVLVHPVVVREKVVTSAGSSHRRLDQPSSDDDVPEPLVVLGSEGGDLQPGHHYRLGEGHLNPGLVVARLAPVVFLHCGVIHNVVYCIFRQVVRPVHGRVLGPAVERSVYELSGEGLSREGFVIEVLDSRRLTGRGWITDPHLDIVDDLRLAVDLHHPEAVLPVGEPAPGDLQHVLNKSDLSQ